jgi:hypothetical protein
MRAVIAIIWVGFAVSAVGSAAQTIAKWEEQPFFARKPGEKVPPPAFFATTKALPAGAEVRIKVVQCPKDALLEVHRFIGGPVFSTASKSYADLSTNETVTHKLDKEMRVAITTSVNGERGRCKGIDRKDGYDVLTYSFDKLGDLVIEVDVVGK